MSIKAEEKLRRIVKKTGWTQEVLAEKLDAGQASVSRWFAGGEPRGKSWMKIDDLYNEICNSDVSEKKRSDRDVLLRTQAMEIFDSLSPKRQRAFLAALHLFQGEDAE